MAKVIGKKRFFHRPSPKQIRRAAGNRVEELRPDADIASIVVDMRNAIGSGEDVALCLTNCVAGNPIIPRDYYEGAYAEEGLPHPVEGPVKAASWYFLRHGPVAEIRRFDSVGILKAEFRRRLLAGRGQFFMVDLRGEAYDKALKENEHPLAGIAFGPVKNDLPRYDKQDNRLRRYSLVSAVQAEQIIAYCAQFSPRQRGSIQIVKPYQNVKAAAREGAKVRVSVPSRTSGKARYKFDVHFVPVGYNHARKYLPFRFRSTLRTGEKDNLELGFADDLTHAVPEEIAAVVYHAVDFYEAGCEDLDRKRRELLELNRKKRIADFDGSLRDEMPTVGGNRDLLEAMRRVPIEMCIFPLPAQDAVDFYLFGTNRVIVQYVNGKGKISERPLAKGELEALVSEDVRLHQEGLNSTFFIPPGHKLQDLNFTRYIQLDGR